MRRVTSSRLPLLLLILVAIAGAGGCGLGGRAPRGVVLVVVDTLRADRLSAYGNPRHTSPNLDRLASEGALFERVYSNACWTLPGFVGLLAGSYPSAHVFQGTRLARSLVEQLRGAGFATAAVTEGGYVSPHFGLDLGFESFETREGKIQLHGAAVGSPASKGGGVEATFASAFAWLRAHADRRFFLLVHTYAVHVPYLDRTFAADLPRGAMPEVYSVDEAHRVQDGEIPVGETEIEYVRALYDGGIAAVDREMGRLRDLLDELGIADRTVVVVTADHGEELGERAPDRLGMHGTALYDSQLHIPLIVRDPTRALVGRRVAAQVRLVDVLPTVFDLVGIPVPPDIDGRSLLPLLDGRESADRPAYAELLHPNSIVPLIRHVALRAGRFKLIVNAPPLAPGEAPTELYDVTADPGEKDNLVGRDAPRADALAAQLRQQREAIERQGLAGFGTDPIRDDVREQLRALGYVR